MLQYLLYTGKLKGILFYVAKHELGIVGLYVCEYFILYRMYLYNNYIGEFKPFTYLVLTEKRGYFETGKVELTRKSSEISFTYLKLILDGYAMISAIQLATISSINIKEVYLW